MYFRGSAPHHHGLYRSDLPLAGLTDSFFFFFGRIEVPEYDTTAVWEKMDLKLFGLDSILPLSYLINKQGPALQLHELSPIDAILLSHEDHLDNLDPEGRKLLERCSQLWMVHLISILVLE